MPNDFSRATPLRVTPAPARIRKAKSVAYRCSMCPRCKGRGKILTAVKGWCPTCNQGYVRR